MPAREGGGIVMPIAGWPVAAFARPSRSFGARIGHRLDRIADAARRLRCDEQAGHTREARDHRDDEEGEGRPMPHDEHWNEQ